MTDPITRQPFNPLAYLPVILLVGSIAGVWSNLNSDIVEIRKDNEALAIRMTAGEARGADREARTRALEQAVASLLAQLEGINQGIVRIERRLDEAPSP